MKNFDDLDLIKELFVKYMPMCFIQVSHYPINAMKVDPLSFNSDPMAEVKVIKYQIKGVCVRLRFGIDGKYCIQEIWGEEGCNIGYTRPIEDFIKIKCDYLIQRIKREMNLDE